MTDDTSKSKDYFDLKGDLPRDNQYDIHYLIYTESGDDIDESKIPIEKGKNVFKNSNTSCFSSLPYEISHLYPKSNRMVFMMSRKFESDIKGKGIAEWVEICRKHNLIPNYITDGMIEKRTPVYKFLEHNPSLMYIYLSALRMPQEFPGFVKAMLQIYNKHKIDFYTAWAISSVFGMSNSNHNIMNLSKPYATKSFDSLYNTKIPINYIRGFRKYMQDPYKYDTRKMRRKIQSCWSPEYKIYEIISSLCTLTGCIRVKDFLDPEIKDAMIAESDDEAEEIIKGSGISYTAF